ncbi:MAG: penicillin-binding protein 2 [Patescibacteria group bacterium]
MIASSFKKNKRKSTHAWRMKALRLLFVVFTGIIIFRLFSLQILNANFYEALASGQHSFYQELFAERGSIFVRDWKSKEEYVVATNEPRGFVFADPRRIENPEETTRKLCELLGHEVPAVTETSTEAADGSDIMAGLEDEVVTEEETVSIDVSAADESAETNGEEDPYATYKTLLERLSKQDDPYEPVERGVSQTILDKLDAASLAGIDYVLEESRSYPEAGLGGHIFGFVRPGGEDRAAGQYGLEGYFDEFLAGTNGFLDTQTDASGRWIAVGSREFQPAVDGGDLLLTIDRTVQYIACKKLSEAVAAHQADGGSVVIMHPQTGKIIAMCNVPDFDPNAYQDVEDISVYNNTAIFEAYESGSVFKPLVMAAAIDMNVVEPTTTYVDEGEVKVDDRTIRNSDLLAHGLQTMTGVLELSLNTGMVFVSRRLGAESMRSYIEKFGFATASGIELDTESSGNTETIYKSSEIYQATASYGQGITVTLLQLTTAYGAIANGGMLMEPYIVQERRHANGTVEEFKPKTVRQVISKKTATTIGAMMVSVVENGHAEKAAVPGYYVAGKTGTAQVARKDGRGYETNITKATFAGFGPVSDPVFVMAVYIDHPRTIGWASDTAAPVWGDIAEFLLQYFEVAPTRALE